METNWERIYKSNYRLHVKVNLNTSLFPVLENRCPPPTLFKNSQEGLRKLGIPHLYSRTGNKEKFE